MNSGFKREKAHEAWPYIFWPVAKSGGRPKSTWVWHGTTSESL